MMTTIEIADFFGRYVEGIKTGLDGQRSCKCPFHEDRQASFSFNAEKGVWKCHAGCGEGGLKDFARKLGLPDNSVPSLNSHSQAGEITATYDYRDENGNLLFQVVRFTPKGFRQRRPDRGGTVRRRG